MSEQRAHALLSASSAERWLHCTPSARLEDTLPDTTSDFAAAGTLAHAIAELKVRKAFVEALGPRKYAAALKKLKEDPLYTPDMEDSTNAYLEYIQQAAMEYPSAPLVEVERRLDFSSYVPQGFGTGDCILVGGDLLHVVDYKNGNGKLVRSENNPQMMLYALGALDDYAMFYNISRVRMTIVQPNRGNLEPFEMTAQELRDWGESIKPLAQRAFNGTGEFTPGDWCQFCRARHGCKALADSHGAAVDFAQVVTAPQLLTPAQLGEWLPKLQAAAKYTADLQEYVERQLLAGEMIPGWKLVEGRSVRAFTDPDAALEAIINSGVPRELVYESKPKSLTGLEALVGKKPFAELLGAMLYQKPGRPTLVPENDPREPFSQAKIDFAGVENT